MATKRIIDLEVGDEVLLPDGRVAYKVTSPLAVDEEDGTCWTTVRWSDGAREPRSWLLFDAAETEIEVAS